MRQIIQHELVARMRAVGFKVIDAIDPADAFAGAKLLDTLINARDCIEAGCEKDADKLLSRLESSFTGEASGNA